MKNQAKEISSDCFLCGATNRLFLVVSVSALDEYGYYCQKCIDNMINRSFILEICEECDAFATKLYDYPSDTEVMNTKRICFFCQSEQLSKDKDGEVTAARNKAAEGVLTLIDKLAKKYKVKIPKGGESKK